MALMTRSRQILIFPRIISSHDHLIQSGSCWIRKRDESNFRKIRKRKEIQISKYVGKWNFITLIYFYNNFFIISQNFPFDNLIILISLINLKSLKYFYVYAKVCKYWNFKLISVLWARVEFWFKNACGYRNFEHFVVSGNSSKEPFQVHSWRLIGDSY